MVSTISRRDPKTRKKKMRVNPVVRASCLLKEAQQDEYPSGGARRQQVLTMDSDCGVGYSLGD